MDENYNIKWEKLIGDTFRNSGDGNYPTGDSGVIYFQDRVDSPQISHLIKLDSMGIFQWATFFPVGIHGVTADDNGGIFVNGVIHVNSNGTITNSNLNYDGSNNYFTHADCLMRIDTALYDVNATNKTATVFKFSTHFQLLQFPVSITTTDSVSMFNVSVGPLNNGNILVTGFFNLFGLSYTKIFYIELDQSLNLISTKVSNQNYFFSGASTFDRIFSNTDGRMDLTGRDSSGFYINQYNIFSSSSCFQVSDLPVTVTNTANTSIYNLTFTPLPRTFAQNNIQHVFVNTELPINDSTACISYPAIINDVSDSKQNSLVVFYDNESFHVSVLENSSLIQFFNVEGKPLYSRKINKNEIINGSDLNFAEGIYFVRSISFNGKTETNKLFQF